MRLHYTEPLIRSLNTAILVVQARQHEYFVKSPLFNLRDLGWSSAVLVHTALMVKSFGSCWIIELSVEHAVIRLSLTVVVLNKKLKIVDFSSDPCGCKCLHSDITL